MRDPRLAELDLLMSLERNGPWTVEVQKNSKEIYFELAGGPLREMLAEFIEQGFVNGNASAMDRHDDQNNMTHNLAMDARINDLNRLRLGHPVTLRIGHKGRVRLWQLRDELHDETREPFGLYARRGWDRDLATQLLFATPDNPLSILFADVDRFKKVNDEEGHLVGDEVLKRVFAIIRDLTADRAYRYGGEEVGALLANMQLNPAAVVAEAIRRAVEVEVFEGKAGRFQKTISIGVTCLAAPAKPEEACQFVDDLMLRAKAEGRNRLVVERFPEP